ncbi:hypothetical protein BGZ68_002954 [Mortierella alpina]|nr:hypothetical protein BGZ68_002954 [Mortierella alpina]
MKIATFTAAVLAVVCTVTLAAPIAKAKVNELKVGRNGSLVKVKPTTVTVGRKGSLVDVDTKGVNVLGDAVVVGPSKVTVA